MIREVRKMLKKRGYRVLMVDAGPREDVGAEVLKCLQKITDERASSW